MGRTWKCGDPWLTTLTYSHMEWGVFAYGSQRLLLNGDQPALGQRVAVHISRPVGHGFTLTAFGSRQLDASPSIPPHTRWRAQTVLTYRFADWLNRFPRRAAGGKGEL